MEPVEHIEIKNNIYVKELIEQFNKSGVFSAGKLGRAAEIVKEMVDDKECRTFLGVSGALVPGGMKRIIVDMLNKGCIDVLVTTGANVTHDIIESLGHRHYKGRSDADDVELERKNIDRIYDVYMKDDVYKDLDNFVIGLKDKFEKKKLNIKEFLWEVGKHIKNEDSIVRACYKNNIPIFCPALSDSGFGQMCYVNLVQKGIIDICAFDDLNDIQDIAWTAKRIGVIYLGGGVPKNYIQQAMQFTPIKDKDRGGADYGVQITMDRPEHGGSSGAPLKEGISWGKMKYKGKRVTVMCDVTVALPIIWAYLKSF